MLNYTEKLINEIKSLKPLLIQMGFDWPLNENYNDIQKFMDKHVLISLNLTRHS